MNILCYLLVSALVLCGTGCARDLQTGMEKSQSVMQADALSVLADRPETGVTQQELSNTRIATNVVNAYRNARYLEFFAQIEQVFNEGPVITREGPYHVLVRMAEHRFKVLATDQKRGLIVGVSLLDGMHSELWPKDPVGIFTTASEHPQGRGDILKKENDDVECNACIIGSYLVSWVGDPGPDDMTSGFIDFPGIFRNIVLGGKRLPDGLHYGRDCYVFKQLIDVSEPGGLREFISHIIYVDKVTHFVLRWETIQPPGTQRTREYEIFDSRRPPRGMNWNLDKIADRDIRIIPRIRD